MTLSPAGKLAIIGLLLALGFFLDIAGLLDAGEILRASRSYAQYWWLVVIIIVAQALMFTFALAGSLFLWVVAPLYPPLTATLILTIGSTLGGLGAYLFSRALTDELKNRVQQSAVYRLLQGGGPFLTQLALRVFPGFPHSVVNYSAGLLRVRLVPFVIAAILGIALKTYVYAGVIYQASNHMSIDMLLDVSVYGPLLILSLLCLVGVFLKYKITSKI